MHCERAGVDADEWASAGVDDERPLSESHAEL